MQQASYKLQAISQSQPRAVAVADGQHALMRGLVNGFMLSLVLWTAIGYLAFALR